MDGQTHINIYSKGKTELGRWLSNFTEEPIWLEDQVFNSIETYWYWLGINLWERHKVKKFSGSEAKINGRKLKEKFPRFEQYFKLKIIIALCTKLLNNKKNV